MRAIDSDAAPIALLTRYCKETGAAEQTGTQQIVALTFSRFMTCSYDGNTDRKSALVSFVNARGLCLALQSRIRRMEGKIPDEPTSATLYRDRARYAEEQALASATAKGRDVWLYIAQQYRTLAGFADRRRDDGF